MEDFKTLVQIRRSHRKFTDEEISADDVKLILRAALMSPTSKGRREWQFVVVDDKNSLEKISDARDVGSKLIKGASLAVVVLGDPMTNDCWVEDASIAAISMQYQAALLLGADAWPRAFRRHVCRHRDTWCSRHSGKPFVPVRSGFWPQGG